MRAKILREEMGEPVRTEMQRLGPRFCDNVNAAATDMLAQALARYQGNAAQA
jgi:thymidine phosphorylase